MSRFKYYIFTVAIFISGCSGNEEVKEDETVSEHAIHNMAQSSAGYADSVNAGLIATDTLKGSPHRIAMGNICNSHIHIEYSSPGVKNRVIWGGLVPYNEVWVAGAHKATKINFSDNVIIGGNKINAGIYALFAIPGKEKWTIIINKKYNQHLADEYKEMEDVARITVIPEFSNNIVQRLTYMINEINEKEGLVTLQWEKINIKIPIICK